MTVKNLLSLKVTFALAALILVANTLVNSHRATLSPAAGDYYQYGPYKAYYDTTN